VKSKYPKMQRLKDKRKQKGLTAGALAEKVGISRVAISYYENGIRFPTRNTLEKLAKELGCKIQDII
jgi:transcriptional regulator with XRE-family HTH domain